MIHMNKKILEKPSTQPWHNLLVFMNLPLWKTIFFSDLNVTIVYERHKPGCSQWVIRRSKYPMQSEHFIAYKMLHEILFLPLYLHPKCEAPQAKNPLKQTTPNMAFKNKSLCISLCETNGYYTTQIEADTVRDRDHLWEISTEHGNTHTGIIEL